MKEVEIAMADIELRRLRYFIAVAEEQNFGRAAVRLHVVQSVLSRQVAALERELGVALLARTRRGTTLTDAGKALVDEARAILVQAEALRERVARTGRDETMLILGFQPGMIVTPLVTRLESCFPGLRVDVVRTSTADQLDVLYDGRADASVVRLPASGTGLMMVPAFIEPRVVVLPRVNPLLAGGSDVSVSDLLDLDLLDGPDSVPEWCHCLAKARPNALARYRAAVRAARPLEEKLEQVAAGRGMVILPESVARFYVRPDLGYRRVIDLPHSEVAVTLEYNRRNSPHLAKLIDFIPEFVGSWSVVEAGRD